jgi:hypothetical protein
MNHPWACSQCRSLNPPKADRCYKCRTPKDIGSSDPTDLPTIGPAATVAPTGRYRSSWIRALLASFSIFALAVVGILSTVFTTVFYKPIILDGNVAVAAAAVSTASLLSIARLVLVVASLVTFAAWISRVIENIPPLTGKYPQATPRSTIVEVLIPFFNFFRIPAILREALRLLDPRGNGDALVAAAILPLILGLLGDWPGGIVAGLVIGFTANSMEQALTLVLAYSQVLTALVAIGSIMLIVVIIRVERQSAARSQDRADEKEALAAAAA